MNGIFRAFAPETAGLRQKRPEHWRAFNARLDRYCELPAEGVLAGARREMPACAASRIRKVRHCGELSSLLSTGRIRG